MTPEEGRVLSVAMDAGFVDSLRAFREAPDSDPILGDRLATALELGRLSDECAGGPPDWMNPQPGR